MGAGDCLRHRLALVVNLVDSSTGLLLFISAAVLQVKSLWDWLCFRNTMLDIVGNEQDVDDLPKRIRRWKKERDNLVTIAPDIPPLGLHQKQLTVAEMTQHLDPALRDLIGKSGTPDW